MIQTICYLRTKKGEYIHEKDWTTKLDALVERGVLDVDYLRAKIIITSPHQQDNTLEDTLEPLVQNLCLMGVKHLLAGDDFSFNYWDYEGTVNLERENENVRLSGDFLASILYPKDELCRALLDCADKFIRFLKLFHNKEPKYDGTRIHYLERLYSEITAIL